MGTVSLGLQQAAGQRRQILAISYFILCTAPCIIIITELASAGRVILCFHERLLQFLVGACRLWAGGDSVARLRATTRVTS